MVLATLCILPAALVPARLASNAAASRTFRRAEFWDKESCSLLDIVNVVGRWDSVSEWSTRTEFTDDELEEKFGDAAARDTSELQAGTRRRYEMAQRQGVVERIALQQNVPQLPFQNAPLAASLGLGVEDFADFDVSPAAVNVVYDALSESKSSLLPRDVCEARRAGWIGASGAFDDGAFALSLYKARVAVISSWFVFGKGNIVGLLVVLKVATDYFGSGSELYKSIFEHQEVVLLVLATAGAMSAVGQDQGLAPPPKPREE